MDLGQYAVNEISENIKAHQAVLMPSVLGDLARALTAVKDAVQQGHRLMVCGNGGSATDALHLAAELVGRFRIEGRAFGAMALVENIAAVTAIANDYSYDDIFARQLEAFGRPGDVLVALSTSGNSSNVVRACETARSMGIVSIGLTGAGGGRLATAADIAICVPSRDTAHIQEVHETIGHIIAGVAERAVRGETATASSVFG